MIVLSRKNRKTQTQIALHKFERNTGVQNEYPYYELECRCHGQMYAGDLEPYSMLLKSRAIQLMSRPDEWCPDCAQIIGEEMDEQKYELHVYCRREGRTCDGGLEASGEFANDEEAISFFQSALRRLRRHYDQVGYQITCNGRVVTSFDW